MPLLSAQAKEEQKRLLGGRKDTYHLRQFKQRHQNSNNSLFPSLTPPPKLNVFFRVSTLLY